MANQSLTDLTARTATADTDLIHVNSGGTDYKESKADFLQGDFNHTFSTDTNLTTQADALPTGHWFGSCSAYGHQTATGAPVNSFGIIAVRKGSSTNCVLDYYVPSTGDVYRKGRTANGWDGSWTQQPTRDEITSLNSSLANTSLKYSDHTYSGTFTPNSSGYVKLGSIPTDFGVSINNYFVGFLIRGWSGGQGALTLAIGSNGTDLYLLSSSTTSVTSINIRMWYVPTAST